MRHARDGDDVEIHAAPALLPDQRPEVPNERLEKEFGETLNASLEQKNQSLDAAPQPAAGVPAAEQAAQTLKAVAEVKSWRQVLNEEGLKWFVTAVLRATWEQREELWRAVKDFAQGR